ncbi:hypothetical protein GCM10009853_020050 [Glycomyces scopariae]
MSWTANDGPVSEAGSVIGDNGHRPYSHVGLNQKEHENHGRKPSLVRSDCGTMGSLVPLTERTHHSREAL